MNQYEEIRNEIDLYLMTQFKYRRSLIYLTPDNIVTTRRNSRIDLYLRIRRIEDLFPPDCLIIARIGLTKERVGHGTHFVRLLCQIAVKYRYKYIGIESTNEESSSFARKLVFQAIDNSNYTVLVENLMDYFQKNKLM